MGVIRLRYVDNAERRSIPGICFFSTADHYLSRNKRPTLQLRQSLRLLEVQQGCVSYPVFLASHRSASPDCSLDLHVNSIGMERADRATQRAKGEGQPHVIGKIFGVSCQAFGASCQLIILRLTHHQRSRTNRPAGRDGLLRSEDSATKTVALPTLIVPTAGGTLAKVNLKNVFSVLHRMSKYNLRPPWSGMQRKRSSEHLSFSNK